MTARETPEERARKAREKFRIVQEKEAAPAPEPDAAHLTDLGNAKRLVDRHGADLRYCGTNDTWLVWDGRRWAWDDSGEIERRAKDTVTNLYRKAAELHGKERHDLNEHARKSEAATKLRAMISLAASEPGIPINVTDLDANTRLLPCQNGTLNLTTWEFREHRRDDLATRLIPTTFDLDAPRPRWDTFLGEMVPDAETRAWMQHFFGYAAAGNTSEHVVPIAYGQGGNGKSTIVDVVSGVLGPYVVHADIETFLVGRHNAGGSAATPDLARLKDARVVMASESGAGRKLNVSRIKDMSGGEPILARDLYAKPFEFTPRFSLWLSTNEKPDVPGNDFGLWRRLRLIPFNVQIPDDKRVLDLDQIILAEEASGVLNWILEGLGAWQDAGRLPSASAIELATEEYRIESDPIGQWLADECEIGAGLEASASGLYGAFKAWFERMEPAHKPISQTAFGREMEKKGFPKDKAGSGYVWRRGIKLRDKEETHAP